MKIWVDRLFSKINELQKSLREKEEISKEQANFRSLISGQSLWTLLSLWPLWTKWYAHQDT